MSTLTRQRETVADEKPFVVKLRQQKPNPGICAAQATVQTGSNQRFQSNSTLQSLYT
jgi:hypothetical protein